MIPDTIVLQSAGSLSVAFLAFLMAVLQVMFLIRKPQFVWYGWSAAISLSGMLYAIGIFIEYNTPAGPINRFGGLLEYTAIICLLHCLYGFIFAYLGVGGSRYHAIAGAFHIALLIILWSTDYIVADRFVARDFIGLSKPFIEAGLGPLGSAFVLYAVAAGIGAIVFWFMNKGTDARSSTAYLTGVALWAALGIHDGLASLGVPTLHYFMEYGFFAFSMAFLWVVFDSFVEISAEDKYRVITEFANDAIVVIQDGKAVFGNPASAALLGRSVPNSAARDFFDIVVERDRQNIERQYNELLQSAKVPGSLTVSIKRADSEERTVEIRANVIAYRNRPAILAVMRDVTERNRKEEALRESAETLSRLRKMESLGLLAGGVAHDLNNVLSGIVGYPDLILMDLPADSKLRKPIETMQASGKRAVAIVEDLLTVARGVVIPRRPLNLNDVVEEYLKTPEYRKLLQYHPSVAVTTDLDPQLLSAMGSPLHIGKALMNLVSNACEAIEGAGSVFISTVNRYLDRPLKGYGDISAGEYAVLTVADSGPGISADDLERIFEPFYTKKKMGRSGTGLGLTLVWNVVQDHEGYIAVLRGERGTEFQLYFPVSREAVADKTSSLPFEQLCGRGEMILVVDDVESQREISCRMLERLGYRTKAVSGGEEAVDYLKSHRVDLMLLDMIMDPGIDGRETYARVKKIQPAQKAIIVSGFAETAQVKETMKLGAGRFIKKPIVIEELGAAIKEELAK